MRLDWEIARRGYRRYAAYPAATVAGAFTNVVFGFMKGYILVTVFAHRSHVGGYDTADTLTYPTHIQRAIDAGATIHAGSDFVAGEVCEVFDVTPQEKSGKGRFRKNRITPSTLPCAVNRT